MLDLGDTLSDGSRSFPFVPECLQVLSNFLATDGSPVELSLVSDYYLADPFSEVAVASRFVEFLDILDRLELRPYFEPVERRVTLSTHANAYKPTRAVFTTALARLGLEPELGDCLFVTENRSHVAACRGYGMMALPFGGGADVEGGFDAWPEGLLVIAKALAPGRQENLEIALGLWAQARHGIEDLHVANVGKGDVISATAQQWVPLRSPELGPLDGVNVQMPVILDVRQTASGVPDRVDVRQPSHEELAEAAHYVKGLSYHHQIVGDTSADAAAATHHIDVDASGRRMLKRRHFQYADTGKRQ